MAGNLNFKMKPLESEFYFFLDLYKHQFVRIQTEAKIFYETTATNTFIDFF
jgi:hypothetical protein